jgi:identified by metaGeneAnnotator
MNTLYLDQESWDLTLDTAGNIALAKDPYAKAQDVASACRLFAGELYYDTEKGIPYFEEMLGKKQSFALYRHRLVQAALSVPGVVAADVAAELRDGRVLSGSLQFTDDAQKQYEVTL